MFVSEVRQWFCIGYFSSGGWSVADLCFYVLPCCSVLAQVVVVLDVANSSADVVCSVLVELVFQYYAGLVYGVIESRSDVELWVV